MKEEDLGILMECLDKNKDGHFDFSDFISQIPLVYGKLQSHDINDHL